MEHPRYRRFVWHPMVACVPFLYFLYLVVHRRNGWLAWLGLVVCGLWYLLSLANRKNNRVLDWMYRDE